MRASRNASSGVLLQQWAPPTALAASASSLRMTPASIGTRRTKPAARGGPRKSLAIEQPCAANGQIKNRTPRHQSDAVRTLSRPHLHDDKPERIHLLSSSAFQRHALRRQFDEVRTVDPVGLPRLQFDERDRAIVSAIATIHSGHDRVVSRRPEIPLRICEEVTSHFDGRPVRCG